MNLAKVAIKRPVSICLVILALVVFGVSSIFTSPAELMPDMEVPMLIVSTVYPGAGPKDVEELVTKKIEDAVSTLGGLKTVTSTSNENVSMVMLQMHYGTNIDMAHMDLKDNLELIGSSLPDSAMDPMIIEINMDNLMDTITLSVNKTADIDLLYFVEEDVVPEFEKLPGIASVSVYGGKEEYIKVELNEQKLKQYHLSMNTISGYIAAADFSVPAGSVDKGDQSIILRSGADYNSIQSLKNIPISLKSNGIIHLSDVAEIFQTSSDAESISRYNGNDNVTIGIKKRQSAGTLDVAKAAVKTMEELNSRDIGVSMEVVSDSGDTIQSTITTVVQTLAAAMLLGMIVLFLFFGDWKASLIVGTSMPISVMLSLTLMNFMGVGFNTVSLGALIISIGNMVDNSVVVLDSCFAVRDKGKSFRQAAIEGTRVVTNSQIAGTLASMVMFLPLAFMTGMSGQMFKPLAMTMIFCSIASVVSAMTVVPLLFYRIKPVEKKKSPVSRMMGKLQNVYVSFLPKTFRRKWAVILTAVALLGLTAFMAQFINAELMPSSDEGMVSIEISTKPGLKLDAMDKVLVDIEEMVTSHPDVDRYTLTTGGGMSSLFSSGSSASMSVYLSDDRKAKTDDVVKLWRQQTKDLLNCTVKLSSSGQSASMGGGSDIEVSLQGTNLEVLQEASFMIEDVMENHPDIIWHSTNSSLGDPQAEVMVDPVKASGAGFTPVQVASTLKNMVTGIESATLNVNSRNMDVRVEYPRGSYSTINDIAGIILTSPTGKQVPLMDIATIEYTTTPKSIERKDNQYIVSISGQPTTEAKYTANKEINAEVDKLTLPQGATVVQSSQDESMIEEFIAMLTAIATAILLIFIVMAMQFESVKFSLVVMLAIPFSLIGSLGLMWATRVTLSMTSLMGFLLLVGTVVNNGILLFDTATLLHEEEGMEVKDALMEAGKSRMRPILMTASISIISMMPEALNIGGGNTTMQGMSIVIIGGLIASTLLTLLLMPTFYLISNKKKPKDLYMDEMDDIEFLDDEILPKP